MFVYALLVIGYDLSCLFLSAFPETHGFIQPAPRRVVGSIFDWRSCCRLVRRGTTRPLLPHSHEPRWTNPTTMASYRFNRLDRRFWTGRLSRPPFLNRIHGISRRHTESSALVRLPYARLEAELTYSDSMVALTALMMVLWALVPPGIRSLR